MLYQWIGRVLGNDLIAEDRVMAPFGREVLDRLVSGGQKIVLIIDRPKPASCTKPRCMAEASWRPTPMKKGGLVPALPPVRIALR